MKMNERPRRNRKSESIRGLVREARLSVEQLIYPLFILDSDNQSEPIVSMPGQSRLGREQLMRELSECMEAGIRSFALFPVVEDGLKDPLASYSYAEENFYLHRIREVKEAFPEATIVSDVAMDPYSSDGHDGVVRNGKILNDESLPVLVRMAVAQAQAGVDVIGPSDMMDGRVGAIREALDDEGLSEVSIMSYTAKYASACYGPFRDALDSAPKHGDKKTYQMDPANAREALREAELDESEGADILMVKPAAYYLDVIHMLKENSYLPIAAYNVSGEYAMIKAAAANGWLDGEAAMVELLTSIRRAGADMILTYFAKEFAQWQSR